MTFAYAPSFDPKIDISKREKTKFDFQFPRIENMESN